MILFFKLLIFYLTTNQLISLINCDNYTSALSEMDASYGKSWIFFPDGDDNLQIMYLTDPQLSTNFIRVRNVKEKVKFQLYTRSNKLSPKQINLRHKRSTNDEIDDFNPNLETKFIVHGWKSSGQSSIVQNIKNNYLEELDCNVIAVDWEEIASNTYYFGPVAQTKDVGKYIAQLIDQLVLEKNASISMMHLIGHSLGAHTVGYAGSFTKSGKIPRITGLDPAKPGFEYTSGPQSRLDRTDGEFVDIIHSCISFAGFRYPLGHIDFYPNGGDCRQPGCTGTDEKPQACSHARAHIYYAESIVRPNAFMGVKCKSYQEYQNNRENCDNETVPMGFQTPTTASGIYYLQTASSSPFGLGNA